MDWFEDWFDSKYYHILYKSRDYEEASNFIKKLDERYGFENNHAVLDLACGKGRHALELSKYGCFVTGVDLSEESIAHANKLAGNKLDFFTGDMRDDLHGSYTHVFNLFTSLGYFENLSENLKVFKSVANVLKDKGLFLIDFLNSTYVANNIVENEIKIEEGISFKITKEIKENAIFKRIEFTSDGKDFNFTERVQMLTLDDFKFFAESSGFEINKIWGDYYLGDFEETNSERLILELIKK